MHLTRISCSLSILLVLAGCGEADAPETEVSNTESADKNVTKAAPNPHSIDGMLKVMDDAKAIEGQLMKRHEAQKKAIDKN